MKKDLIRELNIQMAKGGSGSLSPRISLPPTWIKQMGFTQDDRTAIVIFKDDKIIIEKKK